MVIFLEESNLRCYFPFYFCNLVLIIRILRVPEHDAMFLSFLSFLAIRSRRNGVGMFAKIGYITKLFAVGIDLLRN